MESLAPAPIYAPTAEPSRASVVCLPAREPLRPLRRAGAPVLPLPTVSPALGLALLAASGTFLVVGAYSILGALG